MRTAAVVAISLTVSAHAQCIPQPEWVRQPFDGIQTIGVYQGDVVVGGTRGVQRWDGTGWASLGDDQCRSVSGVVEHQGSLWVCGFSEVRRWNGAAWSTMTTSVSWSTGQPSVSVLASFRGEVVMAGRFSSVDGRAMDNVARWDGAAWRPLGAGLNKEVHCLYVLGDSLYAGGQFTQSGGRPVNSVARWDGADWRPVGAELDGWVYALGESDGQLVAGGAFRHSGTASVPLIARFDGTAWRDIGGGLAHSTTWYLGAVLAVAEYRGQLFAGGTFNLAGGAPARFMARWTGSAWIEVPGWEAFVTDIGVARGRVYAVGGSTPLRRFACRPCPADFTGDERVDFADYLEFLQLYDAGDARADLNGDDLIDFNDWLVFLGSYSYGCP